MLTDYFFNIVLLFVISLYIMYFLSPLILTTFQLAYAVYMATPVDVAKSVYTVEST
uniref:Uncharacterized protein n=1 Tax=Anguilla anguilla TaxID=7936 RepID=A0A0E9UEE5_ANGAN